MKKLLLAVMLLSYTVAGAQQLSLAWKTDSVFCSPESVIYDQSRNKIYVSNINGASGQKDGNGFISRLNTDGSILDLKWIDSLNAPKGMAVYGNKLYVADIDQLVEIDINKNQVSNRYPIQTAIFLNDVESAPNGTIYISDSRTSAIFSWKNGQSQLWLKQPDSSRTNGLFIKNKYLYIGSTSLTCINRKTKRVKKTESDTGGIDGVTADQKGNLLYSNWAGRIRGRFKNEWHTLMDSRQQSVNTADIHYAKKLSLLLVPTFLNNRLLAFQIID